jgi:hypothetical protein
MILSQRTLASTDDISTKLAHIPSLLHLITEGMVEGVTKALVKLEQQTTRERSTFL